MHDIFTFTESTVVKYSMVQAYEHAAMVIRAGLEERRRSTPRINQQVFPRYTYAPGWDNPTMTLKEFSTRVERIVSQHTNGPLY